MDELSDHLVKTLGKELAKKVYDDVGSPPAKEFGKLAEDAVKTLRLLAAPLQIGAHFQDRFEKFLERAAKRVPEERRTEAPTEIVGPAIEHMRHLDESNPLWQMFEEVLTRAIDKDQISSLHPAYTFIIPQLARDEAFLIYRLRELEFEVVDTLDLNSEENRFENRAVEQNGVPLGELYVPDQFELMFNHLEALGLAAWLVTKQDPIVNESGTQTGVRRYSKIILTDFGRSFAVACIPENGFTT